MRTKQRRLLLVGAAATVGLVVVAGPATAHVTVSSTDAAPGGYGKVVVRVPTESDAASTTKVQITMPADGTESEPDGTESEPDDTAADDTAADDNAADDTAADDVALSVSDDADTSADDDNDALARTIAIVGFVVGVLALGASIVRRRRDGGD